MLGQDRTGGLQIVISESDVGGEKKSAEGLLVGEKKSLLLPSCTKSLYLIGGTFRMRYDHPVLRDDWCVGRV